MRRRNCGRNLDRNIQKYVELNKQLASVQTDIDTEITNLTKRFTEEYNTAVQTEALMRRGWTTETDGLSGEQSAAQFEILKHGAESSAELYDALEMKLEEAGITAGLNSTNVDIIDRAAVPPFPLPPEEIGFDVWVSRRPDSAESCWLSCSKSWMTPLRTSEETETISQLPTLAVVPHFDVKKEAPGYREEGKPATFTGSGFIS